ncbi:hypothetical protein FGSG_12516 [Fusarium graminearum PH-1]|uniref:hypothetical protein n=1 Tax=Gibberella zeae (strain ATCC MYA-4620 / CBS 123657 / FGSC 9075 / NRRL 31084 / PH-1) TaxID=229533 RepID=UPI00021F1B28|nr:hypothetical protein FGSG_12516 [Fusarium graminearum PH-1]ESU10201.1 hypothetical protein FGSG_12516 [Fusarium graminearum PH-1]|eukprot:XP_011322700.1 hypothetical protein FGSG_12516 [Fusarium graminearum PH-1]
MRRASQSRADRQQEETGQAGRSSQGASFNNHGSGGQINVPDGIINISTGHGNHLNGSNFNRDVYFVENGHFQLRREKPNARKPCFCVPFVRDRDFVDRPDILTWLKEQYAGSAGRMALVGMGGFGYGPPREHPSRITFALTDKSKSQVAIEFAHHVHDEAPQTSVFWVYASSKLRFEEAYRSIADTLQLPRRNNPDVDVLRLVRDWMQTEEAGSWLMVLDNVDDVNLFHPSANASENKAANQPTGENAIASSDQRPLAAYLPKYRSGTILITSRSMDAAERLTGSHKAIYRVPAMDDTRSLRLLQNKLNGDFDKDAAVDLLRALDYIPLAITQAAAYINRRAPRASVQTYLDAFRESDKKKGSLLNRDAGDLRRDETVSNSVVTTWQVTFEQIHQERPSAAKLLSFISFFNPQGIPGFVLHDYNTDLTDNVDRDAEAESDDFEDDLDVLRGYSLVSVTAAKDVFEVHSLVQFCTRAWISMVDDAERWKRVFLWSISRHFPSGAFETWPTCQLLLPHIESLLEEKPPDEELQNWTCLLASCARYMWTIGNFGAAEILGRKAVETRVEVLGEEHPDTLTSMNNLALTFLDQGRWKEAEELEVGVIEMRKRVLGEEHPDTLISMGNLASIFRNQGRWKEAEELQVGVMEIMKRVLGEEHPDTLISMNNLALTFLDQGRWKEAEELEVGVIEIKKRVLGEEHHSTLISMGNLASIFRNQGRWKEAEELEVGVMEIMKRVLGEEHPDTLTSMNNLAITWKEQGRTRDALALMRSCVVLREQVLGIDDPDTASSVVVLAEWHEQLEGNNFELITWRDAYEAMYGQAQPSLMGIGIRLSKQFITPKDFLPSPLPGYPGKLLMLEVWKGSVIEVNEHNTAALMVPEPVGVALVTVVDAPTSAGLREIPTSPVQKLMDATHSDSSLRSHLGLDGTVTFESHTNLGITNDSLSESMERASIGSRPPG